MTLAEKVSGGLIGMLVGDALGVPYGFHERHEIPSLAEIEFEPPDGFHRSHARVPSGTWFDDGAHALILVASTRFRSAGEMRCEGGNFTKRSFGC